MTADEYQIDALRTLTKNEPVAAELQERIFVCKTLVQGLMGLNSEAGEALDILKKYLFQGHELDKEHLAKELGDVAWYLAVSASEIGYSLEEILEMNVDKRMARYPDGFDSNLSKNRRAGDI